MAAFRPRYICAARSILRFIAVVACTCTIYLAILRRWHAPFEQVKWPREAELPAPHAPLPGTTLESVNPFTAHVEWLQADTVNYGRKSLPDAGSMFDGRCLRWWESTIRLTQILHFYKRRLTGLTSSS